MPDDDLEGGGGGGAWVDEELDQVLLAGDGDLAVDEELGQVLHADSSSPWRCRWRCSGRQAKCCTRRRIAAKKWRLHAKNRKSGRM